MSPEDRARHEKEREQKKQKREQALYALLLLLFAPVMAVMACLGEWGRGVTLTWLKRLAVAVAAGAFYALLLAIVLTLVAAVSELYALSWLLVWGVQALLLWFVFAKRDELRNGTKRCRSLGSVRRILKPLRENFFRPSLGQNFRENEIALAKSWHRPGKNRFRGNRSSQPDYHHSAPKGERRGANASRASFVLANRRRQERGQGNP